jgi:hypothetical protein
MREPLVLRFDTQALSLWEQRVGGSNPSAPTIEFNNFEFPTLHYEIPL